MLKITFLLTSDNDDNDDEDDDDDDGLLMIRIMIYINK